LEEILSLADRIAVIYHGQIVATMQAAKATKEQLGLLMAGGSEAEEEAQPATAQ
jgi:simple sugar transport system ATP-binding protein